MPRYFKDKIYNLDERGQLKLHHTTLIQEKINNEQASLLYDKNHQNKESSIYQEYQKMYRNSKSNLKI